MGLFFGNSRRKAARYAGTHSGMSTYSVGPYAVYVCGESAGMGGGELGGFRVEYEQEEPAPASGAFDMLTCPSGHYWRESEHGKDCPHCAMEVEYRTLRLIAAKYGVDEYPPFTEVSRRAVAYAEENEHLRERLRGAEPACQDCDESPEVMAARGCKACLSPRERTCSTCKWFMDDDPQTTCRCCSRMKDDLWEAAND